MTSLCYFQVLSAAQKPMVIVGSSILQRADGASIYDSVFSLANKLKASQHVAPDWRTLNIMHRVSLLVYVDGMKTICL
jgi:NADH dehydrogenase (ubiquinone) Fe-S protein 1